MSCSISQIIGELASRSSLSVITFAVCVSCAWCRWRKNRPGVLTGEQYQTAQNVFRETAPASFLTTVCDPPSWLCNPTSKSTSIISEQNHFHQHQLHQQQQVMRRKIPIGGERMLFLLLSCSCSCSLPVPVCPWSWSCSHCRCCSSSWSTVQCG